MSELDRARVLSTLQTQRYGRSLTVLVETASTNDDARAALAHGAPDGLVITADHQTQGRGARGRTWESPAGTDLYLSIVDRPRLPPTVLPTLTLAVGVGVADTLDALLGEQSEDRVAIKWPNDVWLDGKKCCGVLVEALATGAVIDGVVIGIGLNVNRTQWPPELAPIATSLRAATGRTFDRNQVLSTLLHHVERRVNALTASGPATIVAAVNRRLALRGELVTCDEVTGTLLHVSDSGALRVETGAGPRDVIAGTLRRAGACA